MKRAISSDNSIRAIERGELRQLTLCLWTVSKYG
jgi:hypothetical protein